MRVCFGVLWFLFVGVVFGQAVDVSAVTPVISDQATPIALIGVAVLGVLVTLKAYWWVRCALDGSRAADARDRQELFGDSIDATDCGEFGGGSGRSTAVAPNHQELHDDIPF